MKEVFKNIWSVLNRKERKQLTSFMVADVMISLADLLSLFGLLVVIRFYLQPVPDTRLNFLPLWLLDKSSAVMAGVFAIFFILKNLVAVTVSSAQFRFSGDVAIRLSENNLRNYQQGDFNEFLHVDSSEHVRKIALQPFEFCQHMLTGMQQVITQVCLIILTLGCIIVLNPLLFLLLLFILLPTTALFYYRIKKLLVRSRSEIRTLNETSYRYLFDALKGYVEGNIYGRNDFFRRRFLDVRKRFSQHLFSTLGLQSMPGRVMEIVAISGLFFLIAFAQWSGQQNDAIFMTIGSFMAAAYKIIPGIVKLINLTNQLKTYQFSFHDFSQKQKIISTKPSSLPEIRSLQLKKISFKYKEHQILKDFSMNLEKGDFVGIQGRSGRGKTTILNLLMGFLSPDNGTIEINHTEAKKDDLFAAWPKISYIKQGSFLIHDSILQNITMEEEVDKDQLSFAMQVSGLDDWIKQFPEGYKKIIAENGKDISGGQRQRIAIARALYKKADVIIMDEPFNELDGEAELTLLEQFKILANRGKIIVMVTHQKESLRYCNKTFLINAN